MQTRILTAVLAVLTIVLPQVRSGELREAEVEFRAARQASPITATAEGFQLRAKRHKLIAEASSEGLQIRSIAEPGSAEEERFSVRAVEFGRGDTRDSLATEGAVLGTEEFVAFLRPGLTEEYRVDNHGVRQDFVIQDRPEGSGELLLDLDVVGASAAPADCGAELTLLRSDRCLTYSRLHVTDAAGVTLQARMEVDRSDRIRIVVDDRDASYPVRVDPTFSDSDWVSLSSGFPGALNPFSTQATAGAVLATAVDSSGNLFVGGNIEFAGSAVVNGVAKWDGNQWSALGSGTDGTVSAIAVMGNDVYIGGSFSTVGGVAANNIAKWDGSSWSALGVGADDTVFALAVSGNQLFVGGRFDDVGGLGSLALGMWNGSSWVSIGGANGFIYALEASGSEIYAGGGFTRIGGGDTIATVDANGIAKWDGSGWSPLGSGIDDDPVRCIAVDGSDVYAGGKFRMAGGVEAIHLAKWNGASWSALDRGIDPDEIFFEAGSVRGLAFSGGDLYTVGFFQAAGSTPANRVAKWDGSSWSALGDGLDAPEFPGAYTVTASGGNIIVGGQFTTAGDQAALNIASWDGATWSGFGSGFGGAVNALAAEGTDLYAAGAFTTAGDISAQHIARWNGSSWSALGSGVNGEINAVATVGDGSVFVGGTFTMAGDVAANNIAHWNGNSWSALGAGVDGDVFTLLVEGSDLYVGGLFNNAGGAPASRIAKWDGSAWSPLGSGVVGYVSTAAMLGSDLYIGGGFQTAGGTTVNHVAKWDGSNWSPLADGLGTRFSSVDTLAVLGSDLYAGGLFTTRGGAPADRIARWNGTSWSPLADQLEFFPTSLGVFDGEIYAGGDGLRVPQKFDGTTWTVLGTGLDAGQEKTASIRALAISDSGQMFLGGTFTFAGTTLSPFIVQGNLLGGGEKPPLSIRQMGDNIVVSWPVETAGWTLESAPLLDDASTWMPVAQPVVDTATEHTVTIPRMGIARLFLRLTQ